MSQSESSDTTEEHVDHPTEELTLKELMDLKFPADIEELPRAGEYVSLYPDYFDKVKDKMQDLDGANGKVKKLIIQCGVGAVVPEKFEVTIKCLSYYNGVLLPVDSFYPEKTTVGMYRFQNRTLIKGLTLATCSMKKLEIALFWIHPDYTDGYRRSVSPHIPPGTEVIILVQMVDFIENAIVKYWNITGIVRRSDFRQILKDDNCRPAVKDMLRIHRMCNYKRKCLELKNQMKSTELTPDELNTIQRKYRTMSNKLSSEYWNGPAHRKFAFPKNITVKSMTEFKKQALLSMIFRINRIHHGRLSKAKVVVEV